MVAIFCLIIQKRTSTSAIFYEAAACSTQESAGPEAAAWPIGAAAE